MIATFPAYLHIYFLGDYVGLLRKTIDLYGRFSGSCYLLLKKRLTERFTDLPISCNNWIQTSLNLYNVNTSCLLEARIVAAIESHKHFVKINTSSFSGNKKMTSRFFSFFF